MRPAFSQSRRTFLLNPNGEPETEQKRCSIRGAFQPSPSVACHLDCLGRSTVAPVATTEERGQFAYLVLPTDFVVRV
jgi:hypothetical protein